MRLILLAFFCFSVLFVSCDDGDIVVTNFNFDQEDGVFDFCSVDSPGNSSNNATVFYKESSTNEIITLEISSIYNDSIAQTPNPISLSGGEVIYRRYTSSVRASELFCQAIAPTNFNFENELISNRGEAILFTQLEIELNGDDDSDGLLNRQEGITSTGSFLTIDDQDDLDALLDTDNDGIPNFRDDDDDNDNVKTINELARDPETNDLLEFVIGQDADGDDIIGGVLKFTLESNGMLEEPLPDHLNDDDDGDGIKTFNEVKEGQVNPLLNIIDGDLNPAFLVASFTEDNNENDQIIDQDYRINTRTFLRMENLGLTNNSSTVTLEAFDFGETTASYTKVLRNLRRSELDLSN